MSRLGVIATDDNTFGIERNAVDIEFPSSSEIERFHKLLDLVEGKSVWMEEEQHVSEVEKMLRGAPKR